MARLLLLQMHMKISRCLLFVALLVPGTELWAQDYAPGEPSEARIWLDRGDEPLLQRGERVRVYYRTAEDAFVAIFHINTDGSIRLLHPRAPEDETFTKGGRDYRLLFPQSSYWLVDEYPGKGYFFVVASPEPLELSGFDYANHERAWDLTRIGRTVYEDPYLAMDDYVAALVPDWENTPFALDFIAYDIGEKHEYPRFLCYDCHGFRSYASWNPYTYACASYRVVVWDDPYFYPSYRYQGTRVVYVPPRRGVAMFEFKERAVGEAWSPLVRTRQPPLRRAAEYVEPSAARGPLREWVPPRRPTTTSQPDPGQAVRRPSTGTAPGRTPTLGLPARRRGDAAGSAATPRAPTAGIGAPAVRRPTTGSSANRTPTTGSPTSRTPSSRSLSPTRRPSSASPTSPSTSRDRPVLQRRPTTGGSTNTRPSTRSYPVPSSNRRPAAATPTGGSRTRVIAPPRSGSSARPTPSRPASRPSVRPSTSKRPVVAKPTKPPPRRKPGGGDAG